MRARLLRGIGANLYAQAATVVVQIVSVPVLLAAWGPARYGAWTLLTAVPAVLAFADGGLVLAGGNAMAMAAGRGDTGAAAALFRRSLRQVGLALAAMGLLAVVTIQAMPDRVFAGLAEPGAARWTLDLVAAVTLLGVLGALPAAALRAGGRYAEAVTATTSLRLAEAAATVAVALSGGGPGAAALAWIGVRGCATPLLFALADRRVPWLRHPDPAADLPSLARPAAAALLMPACFALALQGVTLAVGLSQPPQAVAAFTAVRTLARTLVQAVGLVVHALMPEVAGAAGRGDAARIAELTRLGRAAAAWVLLPGWLVLLVAGPAVFSAWTGGRLPLPAGTLPLVATAAALHGLWLTRANLLLAVNRQGEFVGAFGLATLASVALAGPAAAAAGLPGAAAASLVGEAAMALRLVRLGRVAPAPALVPSLAP